MASNPTFFLKKISHIEVLEEYLNGDYSKLDIDGERNIKVTTHSAIIAEEFSSDPYKAIFVDAISKYCSPILYSTNQKAFDVFRTTGELDKDVLCDWCLKDKATTGMVVAHKKIYLTSPSGEESTYEIFWIYGNHCTFECAMGELQWTKSNGWKEVIDCESSLTLTQLLFTMSTGKDVSEIKPTPYYRLLKSRGGPLDKDDGHRYIPHCNIIQMPAKIAFERMNL